MCLTKSGEVVGLKKIKNMIYAALVLLISGIIYFFWDRTIYRKKQLSYLLRKTFEKKSLYGFIMHNIKPELDKYRNHYEYGDPYHSVSRCLMKNQFAIKEAVFHFKNLEEILLRKDMLNQINSWNLKECKDVLSFISKGLHRDVSTECALERIRKGENSLNDLEIVNSESLKPVKILAHPEVIGISVRYLDLIEYRIKFLLKEMYDSAMEERDIEKLMHAHFLKVYILTMTDPKKRGVLHESRFQMDLFRLTGSQAEDDHFVGPYLEFIRNGEYEKYFN